MNIWVQKSTALANRSGYLDCLSAIYPVSDLEAGGRLTREQKQTIRDLSKSRNKILLLKYLLDLERFPYDEPYAAFLRGAPSAIKGNKKTVRRITRRLGRMGAAKIISGCNRSKAGSRQLGQSFRNWIKSQKSCKVYKFTDQDKFLKAKGIAFLDGGDKSLKDFAKTHFKYRRKKGLDFVALAGGKPVIGEAKFISTNGGTQDKSFREGVSFLGHKSGGATYIAVLDGVVWIKKEKNGRKKTGGLYSTLQKLPNDKTALSALLLLRYLKTLR